MAAPAFHTSVPLWTLVSSSVAYPSLTMRRMNASSEGSTCQPSVSAHQSASGCGSVLSCVTWNSYAMCASPSVAVEVAEEADLGAVVDRFAVDVQHERGHRGPGVRSFGRSARARQAVLAQPAYALDPHGVRLVELPQRLAGRTGVSEALVVARRPAEMRGAAPAEDPDDA